MPYELRDRDRSSARRSSSSCRFFTVPADCNPLSADCAERCATSAIAERGGTIGGMQLQ
jgi:hypothetical protein